MYTLVYSLTNLKPLKRVLLLVNYTVMPQCYVVVDPNYNYK